MEYKLEDLCTITSSKRIYRNEYVESGIPFYRGKEIIEKSNKKSVTDELYISVEKYEEISKKYGVPKKGDILITGVGTIGISYIVENDEKFYFKDGNLIWLKDFSNIIDNQFLYIYLQSTVFKNEIEKIAIGSTQRAITIVELKKLKINIPSIETQNKIVKIYNSINKKIVLNNQINDNLQKFIISLYDLMFSEKEKNGKLKDIVKKINNSVNVKTKNTSLKYFPVDVLPSNYMVTKDGKENEEAQSSLIEFKKYDILIGAMRVYFHRVCLAAEDGITRTTTFVLQPKQREFLYYALIAMNKDLFIDYASYTSKGSTMPYAVWENVCEDYDIYIPSKDELERFNIIAESIFEKIMVNEKENRELEHLRDTLLPKLMNGEIDLDKIEI